MAHSEKLARLLRRSGSESESEDDAERRKKPIPKWARGPALAQALVAQMAVDPDEIFKLHQKTCPLNEVFSDRGGFLPYPCDRLSTVPWPPVHMNLQQLLTIVCQPAFTCIA